MAKINRFFADQTARTPLGTSEFVLRQDEFGTEVRRGIAEFSTQFDKYIRDEEELHVTKTLADARQQFFERLRKKAEETPPGAPEFTSGLMAEFDAYQEKALEGGTRYSRKQLEAGLANIRTSIFQSATEFEAKARVEKKKDDVRETINKIGNSLVNAPNTFADALTEAERAADAAGLPPRETTALKKQIREGLSGITVAEVIRQNPSAAIARLKKGEWDEFLDPAKKSSLLDHATSEARRRNMEARQLQLVMRGNQQIDLNDYITAKKAGDVGLERPKTLSSEALKAGGWREDQYRRIEEQMRLAETIAPFAARIKEAPYDAFGKIADDLKIAVQRTDTGLGAHSQAQLAAEVLKQLKIGEADRAKVSSALIRQSFANAFQYKEELVPGDPSGQPIYVSQKPTWEEFKNAVGPVLGENAAKNAYALVEKASKEDLSPERLPAMFEQLERSVKPEEALYAAHKFVTDELNQRDKELREHPGEWVFKNRPEVKAAWEEHARIVKDTAPNSFARTVTYRNAIDLTLEAQRALKVANPVLPKEVIGGFLDQLKAVSRTDPQAAAVMLKQQLDAIGSKNAQAFFRSLARDGNTPPEVRVALMVDNPTSPMAAQIMSTIGADMEKLKKNVPHDQHSNIDRAAETATEALRASIPFRGGGLQDRTDILDVTKKLTYRFVAERGMSATVAAKEATKWIEDQFTFHNVSGSTVRAPKNETVYASAMKRYLATFDGDVYVPPDGTREQVISSLRVFGGFETAPERGGVILLRRDGFPQINSRGEPIFIPWSEFKTPAALAPPLDPAITPNQPRMIRDYDPSKDPEPVDPRFYSPTPKDKRLPPGKK